MVMKIVATEEGDEGRLLKELEARSLPVAGETTLPSALPLAAIKWHESLFQPRPLDEGHVSELRRVLRGASTSFDPLTVLPLNNGAALIDGHHRWTAYDREGRSTPVPVEYFKGTVREAMVAAGVANHKAKLPMTNQQRQDRAWQLTLMGGFSKAQVRQGSGVSDGQAANMRRALRALGDSAGQHRAWWQALAAWQGRERIEFTEAEHDAYLAGLVGDYARRMGKEFGSKLTDNPEIAAKVLEAHFGVRIGELARELLPYAAPDEDEDEDCPF